MPKWQGRQKVPFPFMVGPSTNPCGLRVFQNGASLHHSTKNSCGVLAGGLLASGHVKSPSASTSHEGHMAKFHPLIHSASSDKIWAIRAVAARLDRLWVVSELAQTDFPPGKPPSAARQRPKTAISFG